MATVLVTLNIVYGVIIVSMLIARFYRDGAHDEIEEDAYEFKRPHSEIRDENTFEMDISLIRAFRANLEAANETDQYREKELLQFLCAFTIMKVVVNIVYNHLKETVMPEFRREENEKNKYSAKSNEDKIKSSGGSMFAAALSSVEDDDVDSDVQINALAKSLTLFQSLADGYDLAKFIYLLRKFGIEFESVQEMLTKEGYAWYLTSIDMKYVNILLEGVGMNSPIEWKWVDNKSETVFPLVSVDKCEVPYKYLM